MSLFVIHHVGVFRNTQRLVQKPGSHFLFLHVRGLRRIALPGVELTNPGPFLAFILAGETLDFEFGEDRENWVVQFDSSLLKSDSSAGKVTIDWHGERFRQDRLIWPRGTGLRQWRESVSELAGIHRIPTPRKRLEAELLMLHLLRFFIAGVPEQSGNDVVERFRQALDRSSNFHRSLPELCSRFGYSTDHMRVLFKRRFQTTPGEYRQRRRMDHCMDLIINSTLSLKEIAFAAGFKHFSHFSAAFVRTFGMTAREAVRERRLT